jgi:serine/threonine protein kinase
VKVCPECKLQFGDEHEFCPSHGKRLTGMTVYVNTGPAAGPGAQTIFFNPNAQPQENYDRLIGTILDGRYILMEKMGEGGMGVVFKARHTVIEKIVAVKILKRDVARDRAVLQRFVQEAKAASRIGHGSIVDVTDFGTLADGSAYQVMEYIGGPTLAKVIKEGPMWAARALPIVAQMAKALSAAHEKGIVHRDLKPDNIFLVERNGRPDMIKIVDFGVAKFAPMGTVDGPRLTRAGAVFGTPEYMAPEQAAGRSDNDHRVDIYALGTVLYELVVGRVPHKGETIVATLAQQMLDPIIPPRRMNPQADVTDRLEQVIMTAVAKDRDRRYQTMADFWVGLEWAAVELGVVLEPPTGGSGDLPIIPTPQGVPTYDQLRHSDRYGHIRSGLGGPTVPDARESQMLEADLAAAASRARFRRFSVAAASMVGIAAATLGIAFAVRSGQTTMSRDGGPHAGVAADAGAHKVHVATADASAVATRGADAATIASGLADDAGVRAVIARSGDGRDGGAEETSLTGDPTLPRMLSAEIAVTTQPNGASLYLSGLAAGGDGMVFKRPRGTKLEVRCLFPGNDRWEPGKINLVFDGSAPRAVCQLTRKTRCVKDLHNPFRQCPD